MPGRRGRKQDNAVFDIDEVRKGTFGEACHLKRLGIDGEFLLSGSIKHRPLDTPCRRAFPRIGLSPQGREKHY